MRTVLIIDDEPSLRAALKRVFEKSNSWQAFTAENGFEGEKVWKEQSPDVVFLDILMPKRSGLELLQVIGPEVREKTKVILMSAFSGTDLTPDQIRDQCEAFVKKPFENIFFLRQLAEELVSGLATDDSKE